MRGVALWGAFLMAHPAIAQSGWIEQEPARQAAFQLLLPIESLFEDGRQAAGTRLAIRNRDVSRSTRDGAAARYIFPALAAEKERCRELGIAFMSRNFSADELHASVAALQGIRGDALPDHTPPRIRLLLTEFFRELFRACHPPQEVIETVVQLHREALVALGINPERP